MDLIIDTVKELESIMKGSGCEDSGVVLDVTTGTVNCQFERGVCMTASFGGRSADFITFDPVRATTKISFMFNSDLDTLPVRGAAVAIVNVAAGFFCLSRTLHSCPESSHAECLRQLAHELAGRKIFYTNNIPVLEMAFRSIIVKDPQDADVIIINGEGSIEKSMSEIYRTHKVTKRILCLGPSTAGIARLNHLELWCPYGTC
jgi:hypothetical protein